MRRITALSVIFGLFAAVPSARAADLFEMPLAPIWSGLYVGGHVGGLWNDGGDTDAFKKYKERHCYESCYWEWSDWKETNHIKFEDDDDDVTLIGGVHVGYNWQNGADVFGVEGDVSFADGLDYLASLRVRLGYAMDNFLLYATAGVAFAGFDDTTINAKIYGVDHSFSFDGQRKIGAVVGAGVEYKLASNWSLGVEGLYYAFGDSNGSDDWYAFCKKWKLDHEDDNDLFVIRARMSYHFQDAYEAPLK